MNLWECGKEKQTKREIEGLSDPEQREETEGDPPSLIGVWELYCIEELEKIEVVDERFLWEKT